MIGTSTAEYIWVKTWVIILHSIAPLCATYFVLAPCLCSSLRLWKSLEYWVFAETVFYVLTYLYQSYHLQRPALHPPLPSQEERHKLFDLCQDSTQDHGRYISRWFLDVPLAAIKRENIKEFFRWAFLNTAMDDPIYDDEVEGYVKKLEMGTGMNFQPGRADVKCLRLTLDKVDALHRSLIWYIVRTSFYQVVEKPWNANRNLSVVHLRGRHRYTCLYALPQFSILPVFDCALHRRFPSAATGFDWFPSFARQRPDVLVSPSYISQGIAGIVSPRYRSWPIPVYEIS
jgi:hypothetical protein